MMNRPVAIYLHLPFCQSRCSYCNFYSTTRADLMDSYTDALCNAIAAAPLQEREAASLYFGGGTPSLLGSRLVRISEAVKNRLPLVRDAEITLEANPGTVTGALLLELREAGFNRISFGLQDNRNPALRQLGRTHTAEQGREAVSLARAAGFDNISVDIMLATPGQTVMNAAQLCRAAAELEVEHISAYLLKIEPDTPFGRTGIAADCPDADTSADIYLSACRTLRGMGYCHYEISNFCKPGRESRHNLAYWRLEDYLGIGPSAYSLMDGRRFHFAPSLEQFLVQRQPWNEVVYDEPGGGAQEYLMLSLRLAEGLDTAMLRERYGLDTTRLLNRAAELERRQLANLQGSRVTLTERGFLVSNSVICYLADGTC